MTSRQSRHALLPTLCLFLLTATAAAQGPTPVVAVADVIRRDVAIKETFVGTAEPVRHSIVGSAVDGRVLEILVEEGDYVDGEASSADGQEKWVGRPLVQLRTRTIDLEIAGAEAELRLREAELAEMIVSQPEDVAQALAQRDGAEALQQRAKARYERLRTLRSGAASQEEIEESYSGWIAAQNVYKAAAANYERTRGSQDEKIDQAQARVAIQREMVNSLEDRKEKYTIRAPFPGYVVRKQTEVGAWIKSGDPALEVVQLDPIQVEFAVPEDYISRVRSGMDVSITFAAYPGRPFPAQVFRVVPVGDPRARSFPVLVRLDNPTDAGGNHLLKAGMLARAISQEKVDALLIPKDALILGGPQPLVAVVSGNVKPGGTAPSRMVPITVSHSHGPLVEIEGEIQEGEFVVIEGNERLRGNPMVKIARMKKTEEMLPE